MAKDEKDKEKKTSKIDHEIGSKDTLAEDLLAIVNKASKDTGNVAFFLDKEDDPSNVTDWISTGNSELDLAISNRPHGGFPVGRICELSGLEGCVHPDTIVEILIEN